MCNLEKSSPSLAYTTVSSRSATSGRGAWSPTFLRSKMKKMKQRKKRKSFKAETIKRLSPKSKCYCFSHSRVSKIKTLSCWSTMVSGNTFQCSIAPSLWNQFYRSVTTQKTGNNRNISSSRSDNCNSKFSINVEFEKDNHLDFQYFRKSARNSRSKCRI